MFIDHGVCPKLHTLIVDEAQDLSKLQWRVVHTLAEHADKIYAAGDDDQAIYRWAGASVENFMDLQGNKKVLNQSYRVPQEAHKLANTVLNNIGIRVPKTFKPSDIKGEVNYHFAVDDLDLSQGTWLLLARNAFLLKEYKRIVEMNGYEDDDRIVVSTIHGVKGGEAEHVAIISDMAYRSYKYMERFPDDEHRVFYVAITRAKVSIHIIQPKSRIYYEI
jgi:superfamily I DNA/RNA helicase